MVYCNSNRKRRNKHEKPGNEISTSNQKAGGRKY